MKISKLFLVVLAMLAIFPCFAKHIYFKGKWHTVGKSITIDLPIEATFEEDPNTLLLNFQDDLGMINVTITDVEGKVVYNESLLTSEISDLTIPLDGLCDGGVLSITDGVNSVYGIF